MANEKRLIDANALLEKLSRMIEYCKTDSKVNGLTALFQVGDALMDCHTVDAVEVVHGRWFMRGGIFRCSECDSKALLNLDSNVGGCREYTHFRSNYCPNCGAKMDGGNEDV